MDDREAVFAWPSRRWFKSSALRLGVGFSESDGTRMDLPPAVQKDMGLLGNRDATVGSSLMHQQLFTKPKPQRTSRIVVFGLGVFTLLTLR